MSVTKNLLITGAGVDKTDGINFPLANQLLPEIAQFIKGDGAEFDKALRQAIPNLRFNFSSYITSAIESLTSREDQDIRRIVERIKDKTKDLDDSELAKKQGKIIVNLFNKLAQIQDTSRIDDETYELINEVFNNEFHDSDFVIDIHKISLSDTFKSILKIILRQSLMGENNPVADAIASDLLDIEQLLIQKFLGFYNQRTPDVKNYIYIAWCLWGYLIHKQQSTYSANNVKSLPFYATLPKNISAITLNYTTFLEIEGVKNVIHFHGGLNEYVRMDTRQLLPIEDIEHIDIIKFVHDEIIPNISFSSDNFEENKHVIPSFIPPLKLKPILSSKYIDIWHEASNLIHGAAKIVVIGYSFNSADEHFNDIVRNGGNKRYDIVAPDAIDDAYMKRIEKVFGISLNNLTNTIIQGKPAKTTSNIRLIAAKADEINVIELFSI